MKEVNPGDVVWFEPNEKHWHGDTPTTGMTHIAIKENLSGKVQGLDGKSNGRTVSLVNPEESLPGILV